MTILRQTQFQELINTSAVGAQIVIIHTQPPVIFSCWPCGKNRPLPTAIYVKQKDFSSSISSKIFFKHFSARAWHLIFGPHSNFQCASQKSFNSLHTFHHMGPRNFLSSLQLVTSLSSILAWNFRNLLGTGLPDVSFISTTFLKTNVRQTNYHQVFAHYSYQRLCTNLLE
jgi:hypothetical protein